MKEKKPKVKQGKTKKSKAITAIILAVLIAASSVAGAVFLLYQPAAAVNDTTAMPAQGDGGSGEGGDTPKPHGYLSRNVKLFNESQTLAINNSISEVTGSSNGLFVTLDDGTAMDFLGKGDIFYLDGNENTPLGEPYYGKIQSINTFGGTTHVSLENPMIDEVFDSIYFQTGDFFQDGADVTIETIEGVELVSGATPANVSATGEELTATPLSYTHDSAEPEVSDMGLKSWKYAREADLKFKFSVDLLKAFKLGDKSDGEYPSGSYTTKVYVLPYGEVYHEKDCKYLKAKPESSITEKELYDVSVTDEYRPCKVCKPAVLPGEEASISPKLELNGEIGFKNLSCDTYFDYDNKKGLNLQNCGVNLSGTFFGNVALEGGVDLSFGGLTTQNQIFGNVKLQGLKEKMFPFAYFNVATQVFCAGAVKDNIRTEVSVLPVSLLIVAYVDIYGNVSFEINGEFSYERDLNFNQKIVENGKFNFESNFQAEEPDIIYGFHAGGKGDVNIEILGVSLLLYVTNVNVLDIGLVRTGAEAEGELSFTVSNETIKDDKPMFEGKYYVRGYLKIFDVSIRLKYNVDFTKWFSHSGEYAFEWAFLDFTIFSFGAKLPTRYSNGMKQGKVTASDKEANYFKDENGRLIRQTGDTQEVLYKEDFFVICAIDESYVYILKKNDSGKLVMLRVNKDGGTSKELLDDVKNILCSDEENIYYTSNSDATAINKFNRETEKSTLFCDFDDTVELMKEQNAQFYVVLSSGFSFFRSSEYFYVDKNGNITRELGGSPAVTDYYITSCSGFNEAALMSANGYLRPSAGEVYWLSSDKGKWLKTECVSGWNSQNDAGVFTTLNNDSEAEGAPPYKIVLYKAEDGHMVNITEVQSNQAFFTLIQSESGNWYFIDETDEYLILYTMNKNFKNKQELNRYSKNEMNYSLTECGVEIKDNCLFFYTIDDYMNCKVIKRLDIF